MYTQIESRLMVNTAVLTRQKTQFVWERKYQTKSLPFADKIPFIRELIINNVPETKLKKIYLFGSYAYGEPNKNSDIDLLVVIDNNYDQQKAYLDIKSQFFDNNICPCDLIVKKEVEFNKKLENKFNGVYGVIRDNGVILYG